MLSHNIRLNVKKIKIKVGLLLYMDRSGIEPEASPMPRERSTPDLPAHQDDSHSTRFQIKVSISFLDQMYHLIILDRSSA